MHSMHKKQKWLMAINGPVKNFVFLLISSVRSLNDVQGRLNPILMKLNFNKKDSWFSLHKQTFNQYIPIICKHIRFYLQYVCI